MSAEQIQRLSLEAVAAGCRAESLRKRENETGYCFELFRRALDEGDQAAWAAIDAQYRLLLIGWVGRPEADPGAAEEAAREALERFWRSLARREEPIAERFAHVGALLRYLQQCAVSTMLDRRRREQQRERLAARLAAEPPALAADPAEDALERVERAGQVARVRRWVAEAVSDPAERRVLQLSFERGLTPAEIAAEFPAEFPDAALVRQIKERILRRARRALVDNSAED